MDNGICTVHPERHEFTPDCVQWDGSEETRLREELAEARKRLQIDPSGSDRIDELEQALQFAHAEIDQLAGKHAGVFVTARHHKEVLDSATARATAAESRAEDAERRLGYRQEEVLRHVSAANQLQIRLTAAESALAEARGALRALGTRIAFLRSCIRSGESLSPADNAQIDAALARAGEQEAGACAEGEKAVPAPPGEQGKGGGDGLGLFDWHGIANDLCDELYKRVPGTGIADTWLAIMRKHRLAPAQPAEHPASGGEE